MKSTVIDYRNWRRFQKGTDFLPSVISIECHS